MKNTPDRVPLADILEPVSRPERVDPEKTYRILGAHWYADGLYVKDALPGSQIRADKVFRVEQGDFVYNRLFAWKGSFAVATDTNAGCYVSNEFPCFAINRDRADANYLWRYFSRASAWDEALGLSSGGTPTSRNRLKEEKFLAMEIPLPPLPEQRRIEELAAKIKEARELREKAIQEAHAVIRIRPEFRKILPEFLNCFLNSPDGQDEVQAQSRTTSGLRTLSVGRITGIRVPVPSLPQQRRIVTELETSQRQVEILTQLQSDAGVELDALLPSILDKAFKGEL